MRLTKGRTLLAAVVIAATALAGGAGASTTSVTIMSPKAGQSVSLHKTPYLAVAGTAAFAPTTAGSSRFFLRRNGCGTSSDNPHLSVTSGTDAGDGCGLIVDQVPGGRDVDQGAFIDFPASDGMPLAFDGTRAVTGKISLSGAQVGLAAVDVSLEALAGGQAVDLGSTTASAVLEPDQKLDARGPRPLGLGPGRRLRSHDAGMPASDPDGAGQRMIDFIKAMGGTAWAGSQTQYDMVDANGNQVHIQNPTNVFGGVWWDDTNPIHNNVTGLELAQEAQRAVAVQRGRFRQRRRLLRLARLHAAAVLPRSPARDLVH